MLNRLVQQLDLNNSVRWALATRVWQVAAGGISVILLSACLTSVERGYYMTLWSFVAMQVLVDLGFSIAVVNFSSHEWTDLSLNRKGEIEGPHAPLSRLLALGQFSARWFAAGSICFLIVAGVVSHLIFQNKGNLEIAWRIPLWGVMAASAVSLFCSPFIAILEGCGQLPAVYRFRFYQAVLTNAAVWLVLLCGGGLYSAIAAAGVRVVSELVLLLGSYRSFFRPFWSQRGTGFDWKTEFWPMQWRLAVGGSFSYFAYNLFNPVMFHYHSEKLAGQMGMTRQLLITIQSAAQTWLNVRIPQFGELVSRQKFAELNRVFSRALLLSSAALLVVGLALLTGLLLLTPIDTRVAEVLLPIGPTAVFLLGFLIFQLPYSETIYLRAHRKEPVFVATVLSNLTIAFAVWWFGREYAAMGAALGYLATVSFLTTPLIHRVFVRCRKEWHQTESEHSMRPLED